VSSESASLFTPPGGLKELSEKGRRIWSDKVTTMFREAEPLQAGQFYDPLTKTTSANLQERSIFWTAFPKTLKVTSPTQREAWERADKSRDDQDEYCEWAVERQGRKITRVTFTCEVPEYWDALAQDSPAKVLSLYKKLVGPQVAHKDLFGKDDNYNPFNKWNTSTKHGPVHLIQASNNLDAAVKLAAAATIVRVIDGKVLTAEQELIECGKFGVKTRNSDPHIGAGINELARAKADITLAQPLGLYISDFTPAGWKTPDGTDPKRFWRYTRGPKGQRLRGVFEVPKQKKYAINDITINGRPIDRGGQIADFVSVKIIGVACRFGASTVKARTRCERG
jgi:hypothetical protein